ncbi:trehalose utilization-domain-containing protein [Gymnopilus junonius]|uniref:Trehalose utilization-domain-containing protein n=1 Tax=Gymnopilus junonius TaxID=109634 RepID=A0A9P5TQH1_GYMJU|nr:trehalose utilization-domain-containing protein [Gymnopilus junonius]
MTGIYLLCLQLWLVFEQFQAVQATQARILIYSRTLGFRHDSIPVAINALKTKQDSINVAFTSTEDPSQFTDSILSSYDALVFLSTTGEVLDSDGVASFQKYLNLGGNFLAIHSASDTLRNTTCYTKELGAVFDYHPALQNFTVDVVGPSHPSTSMLPAQWNVQDEAYNFESNPRALGAIVVLSANESSYVDTGVRRFDQGTPHPTAWYQERGAGVQQGGAAGRSFYSSLGHLNETWQDELFMSHILGGISWVLQSNTTRAFNSSALVGNQANNINITATSTATSKQPTKSTESQASSSLGIATSPSKLTVVVGTLVVAALSQFFIKLLT